MHSVLVDCDADSVIYVSSAHGPACHTGAQSCYYRLLGGGEGAGEQDVNASLPALVALNRTVLARASEPAGGGKPSWTAKLLRDPELNCRKVREEADELCRTWEDAEGECKGGMISEVKSEGMDLREPRMESLLTFPLWPCLGLFHRS